MRVSVIVPALNEAANIRSTLLPLQIWRAEGHEVLVADGGSSDRTEDIARPLCDRVLVVSAGRARQMNAGAALASGDVLWFVHADTTVAEDALPAILETLSKPDRHWGRFDVQLSGRPKTLRVIERMMNLRSCLTGICTGDQGIFVRRATFEHVGGYSEIPLMEDIALSRSLRRLAWPACLRQRLVTSSRRWESRGVWRTVLLMWQLRLGFALGVDPASLARRYR